MESPYEEEFLEEIARFMNYFDSSPYTPHKTQSYYYSWKLNNNPYEQGKIFADKRDDKIVNALTLTPKRIAVSGNTVSACEFGEILTDPDYRGKMLYVKAIKRANTWLINNNYEVLYGTPNKFSMAGAVKFAKYRPYPFGEIVEFTKHIAGFRQLLTYLKPQKKGRRQAIRNLLESRSRQKSIADTSPVNRYQIHPCGGKPIEEKLDGLWADSREDFCFFTFRDEKYLNWRFYENPDDYNVFLAESNGEIVGYIVTKITIDYGFKVGTICDFVSRNDDAEIFRQLLMAAEEHLKKKAVRHIRLWCIENSPYFPEIASFGYKSRARRPLVLYSETDSGREILEKESNCHFTIADCDHI